MGAQPGWRPLTPPARSRLGRTPFSRLALTHVLSTAGDTLVTLALAGSLFFSISPSAAKGRVALYLLLTMAPFAVVAPLIGPALDRSRGGRRTMVIVTNAGRAVICLFMARHLDSLLLFPEAFMVLVLSKAYSVTKSALVPATVGGEGELVEANSRLSVIAVVAGFVAAIPGAAVLKIGFLGGPWVVGLAAVAFVAATVAGFRLVRPPDATTPLPTTAEKAELHAPSIRLGVTAMAVLRGIVGFLVFLTAFALRRDNAPSWWFGVVLATSMAGSFLGAAVAPFLRRRFAEERILAGSLLMVSLVAAACARFGGRPAIAALAAMVGLGAGAGKLAFDSIVQRDAPDAVRGRTFARFETRFQLVWVAGAAVPVILPIPSRPGMLVISLAAATAFVLYAGGLSAARHHRAVSLGQLGDESGWKSTPSRGQNPPGH
ncbi:MAG TPA: MFS transporter [Acidimicrobiales bacterium]|nr:MFS transporter [Acidimicrobiales bacterium]